MERATNVMGERRMTEPLLDKIAGPGAWVGPEIQDNTSEWIMYLGDAAVAEIDAALRAVQAQGLSIPFKVEDFPLPTLAKELDTIPTALEDGLGFMLVRGLPRERYTDEERELIYWGTGVHLGTPISQNTRGHLLGHVRDEGKSFDDPTVRGYQTRSQMDFHADQLPVDILGLFCVRTAKSGGKSTMVSALTVHNVLVEERPDLVEILHQPFSLDWRGEEPPGERPWYSSPMFSYYGDKLTSRITSRQYFESVVGYGSELGLSDKQREALDMVQEVANRPELRLSMDFQEGDMQFLNNHAILHARDEYEDYDDPRLKRHLLRMWVALPEDRRRELSPELADRYRFVTMGGIPAKTAA
ncbi:MAG: TauD/TfdA family dioxygenase [Actinobacteria bacterium]|nr:TauD/TfdA family dioxygenase [Actinomycetota bacterium]